MCDGHHGQHATASDPVFPPPHAAPGWVPLGRREKADVRCFLGQESAVAAKFICFIHIRDLAYGLTNWVGLG